MNTAIFTQRTALLLCALAVSVQAMAFEGKHREMDWASELQITAEQQQQIDVIEQRYRELRLEQREALCDKTEEQRATQRLQQEQMRTEIHQVLTQEQRDTAHTLMRDQHRQMQLRHAREVSHRLGMDKQQKEQFLAAVSHLEDDYQWPLDLVQHELARQQFDAVLRQTLTAEQNRKWNAMRDKQMRKWHRQDEIEPRCRKDNNSSAR